MSTIAQENILVDRQSSIATVTINRPPPAKCH